MTSKLGYQDGSDSKVGALAADAAPGHQPTASAPQAGLRGVVSHSAGISQRLRKILVIEHVVPSPVLVVLQRAADERAEAADTIDALYEALEAVRTDLHAIASLTTHSRLDDGENIDWMERRAATALLAVNAALAQARGEQ